MAAHTVCSSERDALRIPYHNKADGFFAALVLTLNQAMSHRTPACHLS